jgi:hypothetical protein
MIVKVKQSASPESRVNASFPETYLPTDLGSELVASLTRRAGFVSRTRMELLAARACSRGCLAGHGLGIDHKQRVRMSMAICRAITVIIGS